MRSEMERQGSATDRATSHVDPSPSGRGSDGRPGALRDPSASGSIVHAPLEDASGMAGDVYIACRESNPMQRIPRESLQSAAEAEATALLPADRVPWA